MNQHPYVSVLIPTYKRAHLIIHVLDALKRQIYSNFEVLIVLKPSGDGTEQILKEFEKSLKIQLIIQEKGYVTDALNLGLKHIRGEIIVFLDDDAVPNEDWLQNCVQTYVNNKVGGVAGDVVPAKLKDNMLYPEMGASEVIPYPIGFFKSFRRNIVDCPLEGLENYLIYISKAGRVQSNSELSEYAKHHVTDSLLAMGANMSILAEAIKGFSFPRTWILGLAWEQYLGWWVWKKGYRLVFNPDVVVNHIVHGSSLSRFGKNLQKETLSTVEGNLLFYRIRNNEPNVSRMYRIVWLLFTQMDNVKKICFNHETIRIAWVMGAFHSETIGLKWSISRKIGGKYAPISDLEKLFQKSKTKRELS
jgi:glycosyltransferase involved in cell wall biosynthesis